MSEVDEQYIMSLCRGTETALKQLIAWKANLDQPKALRYRKDSNDISTIGSVKYWYQSYLNGLRLLGWLQ